ncbi:MAG TPA: PQQ-binding-like beta-propeller repeat protein, partial [Bacteroidota bacterium]
FIHCIDITSGEKKWRYKTSGAVYASAIIHDGIVYCGSDDGVLYALEGESTLGTRPPVRKAVFWEKVDGYRWFRNGVDEVVRDYFKREGYEVVDASGLQDMMNAQTDINVRSVVVFADSRVPPEVLVEYGGTTSFRKYLDKGGKVVWLGPCPLAYVRDSTGALETIDYQLPKKILGIQYPGKALDMLGFYGCTLTPEGMQAGLRGWWVGFGSVPSTEVTTVFALDEYGMANSWIKNYGGPEGTGLLQLWIPRDKPIDLIPIKNAVEYGL